MKKTLSMFLAMIMVLSVLTIAGTTVSAQEATSVNGEACLVGNTVTFTYDLKTPRKVENFQGQLNYSEGLKLTGCQLSEEVGVMTEESIPNVFYYSGSNPSDPYDFTEKKTLITAKFEVVEAGEQTIENKMYIISGADGTDYYYRNENKGTEEASAVTVDIVPAEKVTLDKTEATIYAGETFTLTAKVAPELTSDKTVKFASDKETVATVDANGVVKGVGTGTATITATCGEAKAECTVTVKEYVSAVKITGAKAINNGKTLQLKATVSPATAEVKTVKWTSSNAKVAKVDAKGKVTAVKPGTVTITAAATDGSNVKGTVKITVKAQKATKVTVAKTAKIAKKGKKVAIVAKVAPTNTYNKKINVTTDKKGKKIVKIETKSITSGKKATIKGLKKGKAKVTFTAADGSKKKAVCTVTVK